MSADAETANEPLAPQPHGDRILATAAPTPLFRLLRKLGPGLVTGASDDDPSGIGTYSQAGAEFGFSICWTMLFTYPLMAVTQEISGRIGRTTGVGIAGNIRKYYPRGLLQTIVVLLFFANTINIGADLGAMGDAAALLIGGPHLAYVALFAAVSATLQIVVDYDRYVSVLKWLTLALFAYFGTVMVVKVPWVEVARGLFIPTVGHDPAFWTMIVAVFGTTISPYLFFWQASQEAEDTVRNPTRKPLTIRPGQAAGAIERIRMDTYLGMALSNLVALAIIITTAATLHGHGATSIESSTQAAEALRPVAGPLAFTIFTMGIVGTGLLAVPVLAGSAAYALGEARGWPTGLGRRPSRAKAFYATIAFATALGALLNVSPINPIKALYWSAIVNGVVAVPVMALMMHMGANPVVMGKLSIAKTLRVIGWIATAVMAAAACGMAYTAAQGALALAGK
jgi:NRAMP (natural resistance-associated macrophage protein)-like metal ion transporter